MGVSDIQAHQQCICRSLIHSGDQMGTGCGGCRSGWPAPTAAATRRASPTAAVYPSRASPGDAPTAETSPFFASLVKLLVRFLSHLPRSGSISVWLCGMLSAVAPCKERHRVASNCRPTDASHALTTCLTQLLQVVHCVLQMVTHWCRAQARSEPSTMVNNGTTTATSTQKNTVVNDNTGGMQTRMAP